MKERRNNTLIMSDPSQKSTKKEGMEYGIEVPQIYLDHTKVVKQGECEGFQYTYLYISIKK